jgi:DNA replication protein DnaC
MKTNYDAYYAELRSQSLLQLESHRKECEALDPAFAALQTKRSRILLMPSQGARLALSTVRMEEEALLKRYGLPKDYLQAAYRCPLCQDTGYIGSPLKKKCACRLKLEQRDRVEAGRINERETFENFRDNIYSNEASLKEGKTICILCQRYADALPAPKFPQLLLFGNAGRGKSFMGNAIAARAIERGIDALRLTAYRMTEEVMNGFSENTSPLPRFTQVPLLVLDDLGTEPMIPNVTLESLFSVVDQRNTSRLATVYISNLNADELTERYGERIASRITDGSITKAIRFGGESLRGIQETKR